MSQYSEMIGSFIRTGNYPMEANYIFESEAALKEFYEDPINKTTLHKGLLRIVESDDTDKLALYWIVEKDGELIFDKLIKDLDIDSIESEIDVLLEELAKEIEERKAADEAIYGTDDISLIPEELNSILDLANALTELREDLNNTKSELKAVVGTEEDNIIEYLKTLDYLNLTLLSEALHKFLNTVDEEDTSINTLPELKDFLRGFEYTHNLYECFVDLWNNILGDPTPNTQFRTLRGIQDFVEALNTALLNRTDNLLKEIDQTLVGVGLSGDGSYNSDKETHYLKDATSVMNALKTLDSLIYTALQEFVLSPANKDVVPLEINKTPNGYTIGASLALSSTLGNQLTKKSDGLYYNVHLDYNDGTITLTVNDSIISQFNINISSILKDGHYEPSTEEIILVFNTLDGAGQTVRIPVGSLIREWVPDNSQSSKVVEITREEVADGADKVSADVRISEKAHNILEKDGNSLFVEGTSDAITYNNLTLTAVILDIQNKANTTKTDLATEISNRKEADSTIRNEITEKVSDLTSQIILEASTRETEDNDIKNLITTNSNNISNVSKQVETVLSNLETEILDRKDSVLDLRDDIELEIITLLSEKAPKDSPIFTGVPMVETSPDPTDSSLRIPSTSWVTARLQELPFTDPGSYWLILTE